MAQIAVCPRCDRPTTVHVWFRPQKDPGHIITVQTCAYCGYQWQVRTDTPADEEPPARDQPSGAPDQKDDKPNEKSRSDD
jgi:Zn ribbon nucleic-acid-binding protein